MTKEKKYQDLVVVLTEIKKKKSKQITSKKPNVLNESIPFEVFLGTPPSEKEIKWPALISCVLSVIAIATGFMHSFIYIALGLCIVGIVTGVAGFFINHKKEKILTSLATILTVLCLCTIIGFHTINNIQTKVREEKILQRSKELETKKTTEKKSISVDDSLWTKEDFDSLVVGDYYNGDNGTSLDEILAKYGKPDSESRFNSSKDDETLTVTYSFGEYSSDNPRIIINLYFRKIKDGDFLLTQKSADGFLGEEDKPKKHQTEK